MSMSKCASTCSRGSIPLVPPAGVSAPLPPRPPAEAAVACQSPALPAGALQQRPPAASSRRLQGPPSRGTRHPLPHAGLCSSQGQLMRSHRPRSPSPACPRQPVPPADTCPGRLLPPPPSSSFFPLTLTFTDAQCSPLPDALRLLPPPTEALLPGTRQASPTCSSFSS
ncbi:uncharacterized protein LOC118919760 isoform X2 [Manis pentadactyla]|uniref:uncharacterized protein LOC118919760 isoform X1 n=1 Tax=Manis pentadactyla TaxID=143292 RepID=UPI00255CF842|nr:uncharacterized protein LOC118919760 isoform X1 [Manis pentadactyla]XP_057346696.1 uncharacterized protein LOC118919760 isoform X2 [Manis pentadactyla]